jgi:hypothetical protein
MSYKIKKLVESNFNFNNLYPTAQEETKFELGLGFTLQEIVDFLQAQTNNFTESFHLAEEIDSNIYSIYEKYIKENKEENIEQKKEEQDDVEIEDFGDMEGGTTESNIAEWSDTIETLLELLMSMRKNKDEWNDESDEEWQETVSTLIDLLEETDFSKKTLKKYKKEFAIIQITTKPID